MYFYIIIKLYMFLILLLIILPAALIVPAHSSQKAPFIDTDTVYKATS
jgi:hypothetical protein